MLFLYQIVNKFPNCLLEMGRTPRPDMSGNRCSKLDSRYSTRSSVIVLMSRIAVYSMLTVTFLLRALSSWCQSFENRCSIELTTTRHILLNEAENVEEFIQPASSKPYPYPVLISTYIADTRPDTDFLCSFHPPLLMIPPLLKGYKQMQTIYSQPCSLSGPPVSSRSRHFINVEFDTRYLIIDLTKVCNEWIGMWEGTSVHHFCRNQYLTGRKRSTEIKFSCFALT